MIACDGVEYGLVASMYEYRVREYYITEKSVNFMQTQFKGCQGHCFPLGRV